MLKKSNPDDKKQMDLAAERLKRALFDKTGKPRLDSSRSCHSLN